MQTLTLTTNARLTLAIFLQINNLWDKAIEANRQSFVGFEPCDGATRCIPTFYTNTGGETWQLFHLSKAGLSELAAAGLVRFAVMAGDNAINYRTAYLPMWRK